MRRLAAFFTSSFSDIGDSRVLGLALHRAWIATFFFSANTINYSSGSGGHLGNLYNVSLMALALVMLSGGIAPHMMKSIMRFKAVQILSPLFMSVGSFLLLIAVNTGGDLFVSILSGGLTGLGSGMLLLYWGELYGESDATTAQINSALAFTLAVFIYALFLLFSASLLFIVAATILPLLSGIALLKAYPTRPAERTAHVIQGGITNVARVAVTALIISFVNGVFGRIAHSTSAPPETQAQVLAAETLFTISLFVSTLILAILIFTTIFVSHKSDLGIIYRFVLMFFIVGVLFSPYEDGIGLFASVITNAGYSAFELIFWIALSNISYRYHIPPLRAFGFGRLAWVIGVYLGGLYPPPFIIESMLQSAAYLPFFLISLLIVLVVATYAFILPEHSIVAITTGFGNRHGNLQSRCKTLSEKYGLSQRENEVLVLLVKGRNLASIKKSLNISAGTASTHRQRIYQKTGIHSRQELLDLLELTQPDKPNLQEKNGN
jgi:DNA-binding CsgD family transcriptional regulator